MEFLQNFMDSTYLIVVIILFVVGILCVIKGGDWFVDSASFMAEATGVPKLIVGATIVSIGTTLPELLVSVIAASQGEFDMAAGNAIGSVTANIALIMSIALIFMPATINRKDYIVKSFLMFLPIAIMFIFGFNGNAPSKLPLVCSIILLIIFAFNIGENVFGAVKATKLEGKSEKLQATKGEILKNVGIFLLGAVAIFIGAQLLQTSATTIATKIGISKQIISLTIVAIGTSLPELVTTITAIRKKENSLSVGNIIGANIIDLTLILSLCGIISGGALPVSSQTILLDIPVCFLVGLVAITPALITQKFSKWQGYLNLVIYVGYLIAMITLSGYFVV